MRPLHCLARLAVAQQVLQVVARQRELGAGRDSTTVCALCAGHVLVLVIQQVAHCAVRQGAVWVGRDGSTQCAFGTGHVLAVDENDGQAVVRHRALGVGRDGIAVRSLSVIQVLALEVQQPAQAHKKSASAW